MLFTRWNVLSFWLARRSIECSLLIGVLFSISDSLSSLGWSLLAGMLLAMRCLLQYVGKRPAQTRGASLNRESCKADEICIQLLYHGSSVETNLSNFWPVLLRKISSLAFANAGERLRASAHCWEIVRRCYPQQSSIW